MCCQPSRGARNRGNWEGVTNVVLSSCRNYSIMAVAAVSTGAIHLVGLLDFSDLFMTAHVHRPPERTGIFAE